MRSRKNPLYQRLLELYKTKANGILYIFNSEGEQEGSVVVQEGEIAWAMARDQELTLGELLLSQKVINKEIFEEVNKIYQEEKGRRKLGSILMEKGYITEDELRSYLRMHNYMALKALLEESRGQILFRKKDFEKPEPIRFSPEELFSSFMKKKEEEEMKRFYEPASQVEPTKSDSGFYQEQILKPLFEINGCLFVGVYNKEGELIDYMRRDDFEIDPISIGANIIFSLTNFRDAIRLSTLGEVNNLILRLQTGILLIQYLPNYDLFVVGLFEHNANLGWANIVLLSLAKGNKEEGSA